MSDISVEFFPQWPYKDALHWMSEALGCVSKEPNKILVACGSHKEHVITLGRHCSPEDFPLLQKRVSHSQIVVEKTDRGGGITAHEPGQLVLYPVFSLQYYQLNVKSIVTSLEDTMIAFLKDLSIDSSKSTLGPGVYI